MGLLLKQDSIPLSCPTSHPTHGFSPSRHPRLRIYGLSLQAAGNHGKLLREASGWSLVSPRLQCSPFLPGWGRGEAKTVEGVSGGRGREAIVTLAVGYIDAVTAIPHAHRDADTAISPIL